MSITKRYQLLTGMVWLFIFPVVFYIAYNYFPARPVDWVNILILFALMFLTMLLPIQIQNVSISLERWITLTIFLHYGMFVELIFVQIAMIILLFSEKTSLPLTHKFFVNSLMFSIASLVSASVYHFIGGSIHSLNFTQVFLFISIYALAHSLVNNLLLKLYFKTQKRSFSLFSKGAIGDYISLFLMVPFSVSLYFLSEYLGGYSVVLIGVPFLLVLLASRMYSLSNDKQQQLAIASEIGHELADQLKYEEVLQTYLEKLRGITSFENGYIIDLKAQSTLVMLQAIEQDELMKRPKNIHFDSAKTSSDGLDMKKTTIFDGLKEIGQLKHFSFNQKIATVMTVPVIRDHITEGFILLTSERKNAFCPEDIQMIDILTSYFAISAEKARFYERTLNKSERCGLTKLHNFRYLDRKLEEAERECQKSPTNGISIVMLDIDYFKKINDTYGHESGNVILVELANHLKGLLREGDVLARYGGEEFVYILQNCSKNEAVLFAENLREKVAEMYFWIVPDLSDNQEPIAIQITISLGVASIPEDAKTAKSVLRDADRALYIGGKQAGRNRVGVLDETEKEEAVQ